MNEQRQTLFDYCEEHSTPMSEVLKALERETYLKTLKPQMLSGALQGQLLRFISTIIQPKTILEIGTFTGYTAICLAQGLRENGVLYTIEVNEELAYIIQKYIHKANLQERIQLHVGDAKQIIPTMNEVFDLVFIDAGKKDNDLYFDMIFDKTRLGGYILVDNVLWHGKVIHPTLDKQTYAIHHFNQKVNQDNRVEQVMLPIRDGLTLIKKVSN